MRPPLCLYLAEIFFESTQSVCVCVCAPWKWEKELARENRYVFYMMAQMEKIFRDLLFMVK